MLPTNPFLPLKRHGLNHNKPVVCLLLNLPWRSAAVFCFELGCFLLFLGLLLVAYIACI